MEEYREKPQYEETKLATKSRVNRWLVVLAILMFCAAGIAVGYGYKQQSTVSQLSAHEAEMNSTSNQMQDQIGMLTAKLNEMAEAQRAAAASASVAAQTTGAGSAEAKRRAAADAKRLKQLQSEILDQQKQLKDTQDQVAKNRSDLEGNISSTRDELNGSIARTHDELVALEKRSDRSFFEFDLTKSKRFERTGPIQVSLRKADTKHKSFNLAMLVDDNQLMKKHVNLYEPIWIHRSDDPQPVQIVVNKIGKNHVHGYVSAPKYKNSELAASTMSNQSTLGTAQPSANNSQGQNPQAAPQP